MLTLFMGFGSGKKRLNSHFCWLFIFSTAQSLGGERSVVRNLSRHCGNVENQKIRTLVSPQMGRRKKLTVYMMASQSLLFPNHHLEQLWIGKTKQTTL